MVFLWPKSIPENELYPLVQKLLDESPNVHPSQEFINTLWDKLSSRYQNTQTLSSYHISTMKHMRSFVSGIALMLVLAVGVSYYGYNQGYIMLPDFYSQKEAVQIAKLQDEAFGSLGGSESLQGAGGAFGAGGDALGRSEAAGVADMQEDEKSSSSTPSMSITKQEEPQGQIEPAKILSDSDKKGSGTTKTGADASDVSAMPAEPPSIMPPKPIMPPQQTEQELSFSGDALELTESQGSVYRLAKNTNNIGSVQGFVSALDFDEINLSQFKDLSWESISLRQDKEYGYQIHTDFKTLSISQNQSKWPNPYSECQTQICRENLNLKPEDVPNDDVIMQTARDFIEKYQIDMDMYGEPKIKKDWEYWYKRAQKEGRTAHIPDAETVDFPLIIQEKPVYNQWGDTPGLSVSVRYRDDIRVNSMWNLLISPQFEISDYELTTDWDRIMKFALQGGLHKQYHYGSKTPDNIVIANPQKVLMEYYDYTPGEESTKLYVPAIHFEITNAASANQNRNAIVVPLVKDILQKAEEDQKRREQEERRYQNEIMENAKGM